MPRHSTWPTRRVYRPRPERHGDDERERAERLDQGERAVGERGDVQQRARGIEADRRPPGAPAQQPQDTGGRVGTVGQPGLGHGGGRVGGGGDEGERDGEQGGVHRAAPARARARDPAPAAGSKDRAGDDRRTGAAPGGPRREGRGPRRAVRVRRYGSPVAAPPQPRPWQPRRSVTHGERQPERGEGDGEQRRDDDRVEPVVVGRAHHDEQGERRVQQPQPAPPGTGRDDQPDGDHHRPADVQRGHRGELVRHRVRRGRLSVHRRPVDLPGVDHSGDRQHPGRSQREQEVQHQGGGGERGEDTARPDVVPGAAPEEPDQEENRGREVHGGVVGVRRVDQGPAVQQQPLDRALAGKVQGAFEVPYVPRVAERLLDMTVGGLAAELVGQEESGHEKELADEGRSGTYVRLLVRGLGAGVRHPVPPWMRSGVRTAR